MTLISILPGSQHLIAIRMGWGEAKRASFLSVYPHFLCEPRTHPNGFAIDHDDDGAAAAFLHL